MNRYVWNLRYPAPEPLATGPHPAYGGAAVGALALPGSYQVRLTVNGKTLTRPLLVKMDPEVKTTEAALVRQFDLVMRIRNRLNDLIVAANQIHALRMRLASFIEKPGVRAQALTAARSLDEKAAEIENALYQINDLAPEDVHNYPVRIRTKLVAVEHAADSADMAPTPQTYESFQELNQELNVRMSKWKQLKETDVPAFDKIAQTASLGHR
jgi:hypothetical protein